MALRPRDAHRKEISFNSYNVKPASPVNHCLLRLFVFATRVSLGHETWRSPVQMLCKKPALCLDEHIRDRHAHSAIHPYWHLFLLQHTYI